MQNITAELAGICTATAQRLRIKPPMYDITEANMAKITQPLYVFAIFKDDTTGKTTRLDINKAPIKRIPTTIVTAVNDAIIKL